MTSNRDISLDFGVLRNLLRFRYEKLKRYANELELILSKQSQQIEQDLQEQSVRISESEQMELFTFHHGVDDIDEMELIRFNYEIGCDNLDDIEHTFPKILRYSLLVHSYSWFEHALIQIAEYCQRAYDLKLSRSDIKGVIIEQVRIYFKKVVLIPFPDTGSMWHDIFALHKIRNLVVHNFGQLSTNSPEINMFTEKWKNDILLNSLHQFEFSQDFINRVLDIFNDFLNELFDKLFADLNISHGVIFGILKY